MVVVYMSSTVAGSEVLMSVMYAACALCFVLYCTPFIPSSSPLLHSPLLLSLSPYLPPTLHLPPPHVSPLSIPLISPPPPPPPPPFPSPLVSVSPSSFCLPLPISPSPLLSTHLPQADPSLDHRLPDSHHIHLAGGETPGNYHPYGPECDVSYAICVSTVVTE